MSRIWKYRWEFLEVAAFFTGGWARLILHDWSCAAAMFALACYCHLKAVAPGEDA